MKNRNTHINNEKNQISNLRMLEVKKHFEKINQLIKEIQKLELNKMQINNEFSQYYDHSQTDYNCMYSTDNHDEISEDMFDELEDIIPTSFRIGLESNEIIKINIPNFKPIKPLSIDLRCKFSANN